jgi:hypothetical protein
MLHVLVNSVLEKATFRSQSQKTDIKYCILIARTQSGQQKFLHFIPLCLLVT